MKQKKILLFIVACICMMQTGCTYTEGIVGNETESNSSQSTVESNTQAEKTYYACIEIELTNTITAVLSDFPEIDGVYLNG